MHIAGPKLPIIKSVLSGADKRPALYKQDRLALTLSLSLLSNTSEERLRESMEVRLCETPITGSHLAKSLKEKFGPHAILRAVEAEKIAVGQGCHSHILRVKLTWETDDHLPKSIIVKETSSDPHHDSVAETGITEERKQGRKELMSRLMHIFHGAECELYRLVGNDPPMPMPKCYAISLGGTWSPAFIVLEDLSDKAGTIPCMVAGMSLRQTMEAVTAVAKLHGWSLITTVDWRSRLDDIGKRTEMFKPLDAIRQRYESVKTTFPDHFGSMDVDKLVELSSRKAAEKLGTMHREYMEDVLTHGDFWANNILYEKQSDGSIGDRLVAVIDFQLVTKGNPMTDLARLLTWSVTHELRQTHIQEILRRYYDTFKSIAGGKLTASYEQMEKNYRYQFALSSLHCLSGLPIMVKHMVKGEGDERESAEKLFIERMKIGYDDAMTTLEK